MLGSVMQISRAVRSKFVKTCMPHLLCTASSEFANIVRHDSTGSNGSLICAFLTRVLNFSSILPLDGSAEHGQLHDRAPGDGASTGGNTDKPIGAPTGAVLGAATGDVVGAATGDAVEAAAEQSLLANSAFSSLIEFDNDDIFWSSCDDAAPIVAFVFQFFFNSRRMFTCCDENN